MGWKLHQRWNKSRWLVRSLFLTSIVLGSLPRCITAAIAAEEPAGGGLGKLPFCDDDVRQIGGGGGDANAPNAADRSSLGKR